MIDIKGFKKISSDGRSTVLQHPKGHEIRVDHAALSPKLKKQLASIPQHLADGGEVLKAEDVNPLLPKDEEKSYPVEMQKEAPKIPELSKEDKMLEYYKANAELDPFYAQKAQEMSAAPVVEESPAVEPQMAGPAPESIAPPVVAPTQSQVAPQSTIAPQQVPQQGYMGQMQNAVSSYESGANKEAQAIGKLGQEEATIHQKQADDMLKIAQDYEKNSAVIMQDYNNVMQDYKNQHINPNHYMESMSAGQKVQSAIGIILSGLGAGSAGQENMAAKYLDQQIQRDIDAQKANLGKKANLLQYNMQQFGNLKDATQMTMAMQKGIYAEKLEQAGALAKDPMAKARAMQTAAVFKKGALDEMMKVAANQTLNSTMANSSYSPLAKIQMLPKELRDNALKEYADWKSIQSNLSQVDKVLDANFEATKLSKNLASPIQSSKARDVAYAELFPVIKSIVGEKMTDNDAKTLIAPYLAGFSTNQKTNELLKKQLKEKLVSQARGRTPILSEMNIVPDMAMMVSAGRDEKLLNWAKANPKDPRSKEVIQRLGK